VLGDDERRRRRYEQPANEQRHGGSAHDADLSNASSCENPVTIW
jgi:hypothetical protein